MPGESESTTRKKRIHQALARDGWRVVLYSRWLAGDRTAADAVAEFPTGSGPADYLLHLDGQPVADVEAKKISVDPRNVIEQAKRYSRSLDGGSARYGLQGFAVPFVYSTNGELIFTCDLRDTLLAAREIKRFHTPDAATSRAVCLLFRGQAMILPEPKYAGTPEFDRVRQVLVKAARVRGVVTYKQIAQLMGLPTQGSYMSHETGVMAGEISEAEHNQGQPMLTAILVRTTDLRPGPGFFKLAKYLGRNFKDTPDSLRDHIPLMQRKFGARRRLVVLDVTV